MIYTQPTTIVLFSFLGVWGFANKFKIRNETVDSKVLLVPLLYVGDIYFFRKELGARTQFNR